MALLCIGVIGPPIGGTDLSRNSFDANQVLQMADKIAQNEEKESDWLFRFNFSFGGKELFSILRNFCFICTFKHNFLLVAVK